MNDTNFLAFLKAGNVISSKIQLYTKSFLKSVLTVSCQVSYPCSTQFLKT